MRTKADYGEVDRSDTSEDKVKHLGTVAQQESFCFQIWAHRSRRPAGWRPGHVAGDVVETADIGGEYGQVLDIQFLLPGASPCPPPI